MTAIPQEGTSSNRYLILGRLAGGGMADIFLARSSNSAGVDRYVVLKRVLAERSKDPHFASMFLDEARLASQLQHPNIAQVHDIGKLGGSYFYTMEYVHGEDLRHVLMRLFALRRPFPLPLVLYVASNALAGLHHAHTRTTRDGKPLNVVHRDVSPSNVMVSYEGIIKMLDFGVAKATQHSAESRSGTIKGKIAYLSPEQCQGSPIDRRSDIYSLGIVMHEMITGRRLYKRDTDFATMMAIVQEPVAPPSLQRPDVSRELDYLVLTALEKNPDKRFASGADMIEAIEGLAAREQQMMSGNALGKFMRELFGDRPEPWLEIQAREEETKAITVTGESVAGLDPLAGAVPIAMGATPSGNHLVAESMSSGERIIQQQLDQAPPIARPERGSDSIPRATPPPGLGPSPRPDFGQQPDFGQPLQPDFGRQSRPDLGQPPQPDFGRQSRPDLGQQSRPDLGLPLPPPPQTPVPQAPQAYPIHRPDTDDPTADRRADNPTPSVPMHPIVPAIGPHSHSSSQHSMPAYPTIAPEMMAEYRSQSETPVLVVPLFRRRSFVIFASALVVVLVILAIMTFIGGPDRKQVVARGSDIGDGSDNGNGGSDNGATAGENGTGSSTATNGGTGVEANGGSSAGTNTGSANARTNTGSANAETNTGSANAGTNTGSSSTAEPAHVDAGVAVDAGSKHAPIGAGPASLAELIAAGSFNEASDRCATATPASAMDRARCGVAACNLKQKAAALNYYNSTAGAAQQLIEHSCKDKGIVLKPKVATPPKNPCDDKKFREENPLKCQ